MGRSDEPLESLDEFLSFCGMARNLRGVVVLAGYRLIHLILCMGNRALCDQETIEPCDRPDKWAGPNQRFPAFAGRRMLFEGSEGLARSFEV